MAANVQEAERGLLASAKTCETALLAGELE